MPEVKLLAALKVISCRVSFETFSDYFQVGENKTRQAVSKMARGVINNINMVEKYMRKMT